MRRLVSVLAVLAGLLVASCASPLAWDLPQPASALPAVGVYEPGAPGSWAGLASFTAVTGVEPQIVVYYSGWREKFKTAFAQTAWRHGATVLVQLEPRGVSLKSIADGLSDGYLKSFAEAVKSYQHPVIMSFAHEMNGDWYPWGKGQVAPAVFVAAWRHVVWIFRVAGASNAEWVWTVSSTNEANGPLRPWWPGSYWVNYVGIDGYYYTAADTFNSVFGATIAGIRHFSKAPLLIPETAVGPNPMRNSQIAALYAGAAADHVAGIVWFDAAQHDGIFHQNWRLEDDPSALSAFRKAVQACCD